MKLFDRLFRREKPAPIDRSDLPIDGKLAPTASLDDFIEALRKFNVDAPAMLEQIDKHSRDHRTGIKPPPDSAAENWTWKRWRREQQVNTLSGWAFCRFANRMSGDSAIFVFGLVRGSFGLWQQPFSVCNGGDKGTEILTCITHLDSGMNIGIFRDREVAAEAASLADRVCEWSKVDLDSSTSPFKSAYSRMVDVWGGIGIRVSQTCHCHDHDQGTGAPMAIFIRDEASLMEGRPEKPS